MRAVPLKRRIEGASVLLVVLINLLGCTGVSGKPLVDPPAPLDVEDIAGTWTRGAAEIVIEEDGHFSMADIPERFFSGRDGGSGLISGEGTWVGCASRKRSSEHCGVSAGILRLVLTYDCVVDDAGDEVDVVGQSIQFHFEDDEMFLYFGFDANDPQNPDYRYTKR
ncbi:hypothetical protein [Glycomyces tarimensis]